MEVQSFQFIKNKGWTVKNFPTLDSPNTLILVFAAPEFIQYPEPIRELAKAYPQSKMIGCSSAGEISGSHILDKSLSVAVAKFDKTQINVVKTQIDSAAGSLKAGEYLSAQLNKNNLQAIFVLSDGLQVNGSELVKGLNTINDEKIVITGGLAGDGSDFKKTWVIYNGEIYVNSIVAAGFYGSHITVGHASRGGWDIFGPERRITRSQNNILYELDGRPALALYKEYLGDRAKGLPATGLLYPLAIRQNTSDTRQLVRTILAVDEQQQSLTFAGDVPQGYLSQLMRANFDRLISSASEAGEFVANMMLNPADKNNQSVLAVAISCIGRRLLLGERTEEETESLIDALPQGSEQIGFYSYGEISPYTTGACDLHNQTMTLTTFCEK